MERTQDTMILFRSSAVSKNSKGGDRLTLYMNQDQVQSLIKELQATLENPQGAKLDLHTSKKEYEGRSFLSTIMFVKKVQEIPGKNAPSLATAKPYDASKVEKTRRELA